MTNQPEFTSKAGRHLIVGAGAIGSATAVELVRLGQEVTILTRTGNGLALEGISHVACDATDAPRLATIASGFDAIYNCANPPYNRWTTDWPPLADSILGAAESADAVLVTMSNLYGYGPPNGIMTESHPLAAEGRKGQARAQMWLSALAAHEAGRVRVTEARASDVIGPGLGDGAHMGSRMTDRVRAGKSVSVVGDPDVIHSWTSVSDVARTLAVLGTEERSHGKAWHVPTAGPVTQRDIVHRFCRALDQDEVKVKGIPRAGLRLVGLASPMVRELLEITYQFDSPFVIDSSAATAQFDIEPTPLDDTVAAAVADLLVTSLP